MAARSTSSKTSRSMVPNTPILGVGPTKATGSKKSKQRKTNHKDGRSARFLNTEYVMTVKGSSDFAVTGVPINPGLSSSFAWLSTIASRYNKYRFTKLVYRYVPLVSGFSTEGQKGRVVLYANSDASDPPPSSKVQMESSYPHALGLPYTGISLSLGDLIREKTDAIYVRGAGIPFGDDPKTYDIGVLYIGTEGLPDGSSTASVGEIHVDYEVHLSDALIVDELVAHGPSYATSGFNNSEADVSIPSGISEKTWYLGFPNVVNNGLGIEFQTSTGVFELPTGLYLVSIQMDVLNQDSQDVESAAVSLQDTDTSMPVTPTAYAHLSDGDNSSYLVGQLNFMLDISGKKKLFFQLEISLAVPPDSDAHFQVMDNLVFIKLA